MIGRSRRGSGIRGCQRGERVEKMVVEEGCTSDRFLRFKVTVSLAQVRTLSKKHSLDVDAVMWFMTGSQRFPMPHLRARVV
jgi:hypothetical protein